MEVVAACFDHGYHHRTRRSDIGIGAGRYDFEFRQGIVVHEVAGRRAPVLRVGLQHIHAVDQGHDVSGVPVTAHRLLLAQLTSANVRSVRGSDTRGEIDRLKYASSRWHTVEGGSRQRAADHGSRHIDNRRLPAHLHCLLDGANLHGHVDARAEADRQGETAANFGPEASDGILDAIHAGRQIGEPIPALAVRCGALFSLESRAGDVDGDTRQRRPGIISDRAEHGAVLRRLLGGQRTRSAHETHAHQHAGSQIPNCETHPVHPEPPTARQKQCERLLGWDANRRRTRLCDRGPSFSLDHGPELCGW